MLDVCYCFSCRWVFFLHGGSPDEASLSLSVLHVQLITLKAAPPGGPVTEQLALNTFSMKQQAYYIGGTRRHTVAMSYYTEERTWLPPWTAWPTGLQQAHTLSDFHKALPPLNTSLPLHVATRSGKASHNKWTNKNSIITAPMRIQQGKYLTCFRLSLYPT